MQDSMLAPTGSDAYLELLAELLPKADGFALCDANGALVCASTESLQVEFNTLMSGNEWLDQKTQDGYPALFTVKLPDARVCYGLPVFSSSGSPIGLISVMFRSHCIQEKTWSQRQMIAKLSAVAERLRKEYELTAELNAMANDLTGRYEELNLVYAVEEEAEQVEQNSDALTPILKSCVAHLDVGLAALIMPEKNVVLVSTNKSDPIGDASTVLPMIAGELYETIKANGESLVINDSTDPLRAQYCPSLPYKMLVCPVLDSRCTVIGLLAIMNRNHRADFLNSDRSLAKALAKKISKIIQVKYDALTGLMHRPGFEYRLAENLEDCRNSSNTHSVLSVDVDQLQIINDTIGHDAGDEVIQQVAMVLGNNIREGDVVSYLGRGKFAALLEHCPLEQSSQIAEFMRHAIQDLGIEMHGQQIEASVSVGVVEMNTDTKSVDAAMDSADIARDAAKELGRNRVHSFTSEDTSIVRRKDQMKWVRRIQSALREDRFQLHCQPIAPITESEEATHFEVLVRMLDKAGDLIPPGDFIPAAEHYQLMPTIDRWVITHTLEMLASSEYGRGDNRYVCAVNLSGQSLADAKFASFIIDELDRTQVPVENICFEITETAAIDDLATAKEFIATIQAKGCSFSLDDFGTGLSSFAYLRMLPVDYLKIDGSFVRQINEDPVAEAMVSAINQVGHVMGLKTIAEFVESEAIRRKLVSLGVDYVQGYAVGKPRPLEQELVDMAAALQRQVV